MKNLLFKNLALSAVLVLSTVMARAQDQDTARIAAVRALLPTGVDIAQTAALRLNGGTAEDDVAVAKTNILIHDFDGNGVTDMAVIVQADPKLLIDYDETKPCDRVDYDTNCYMSYGKRKLSIYMNGATQPNFENESAVLGADEGGVFGDPLEGLTVNKKGSLMLSFYGGSAWRWGMTFTIQFRKDNFYLVGYSDNYGWTGDLRWDTSDTNFLTGLIIKTHQKDGDAPIRTVKSRVAVKPLVALKDIQDRPASE